MTRGLPPLNHRWRGGLSGSGDSGLPSPGPDTAVSGGLGGLRSRGTVLGQCRGHLGSFSHHRLPS